MINKLVEINNVSKEIKSREVLKDISLDLYEGKIYGVVGHNGSGKTMLLRLILGLIHSKPTVQYHKDNLSFGAIIENPGFILGLSGLQNLKLLASIKKKINEQKIKETLKMVGLDPVNKKPVKTYSLGMKQKLALAQAIMEEPDVLVLDEPTNGLDSGSVANIRKLILSQKKNGRTIVLTSHNPQDIEELCDEYIELENGKIVNRVDNQRASSDVQTNVNLTP
jgi:ABC-2 type transport system ATP-binding protein